MTDKPRHSDPKLSPPKPVSPRRDDESERERLEPGLNTEGTGGAGAPPGGPEDFGSNDT